MKNRLVLSNVALRILIGAVLLFSTGFLFWKCQFGADLTDEAFYALPAWKLFSLGDKPFVDEIYNAPRQNDWLNYITVARALPFSMLTIRRAAVLWYAFCLLIGVTVLFRRKVSPLLALAFASCLLFDINVMPTWSYNWWLRNGLLVHYAACLAGFSTESKRRRELYFGLAGFALGVSWLAYNSVAPFQLLAVVPFLIYFRKSHRREILIYAGALAVPLAVFGLDFLVHGRWPAFRHALTAMASVPYYNHSFSLTKLRELLTFTLPSPFFWSFGAFILSARFLKRGHALVCAAFSLYLVRKLYFTHAQSYTLISLISVAFWGFVYVLTQRPRKEVIYVGGLAAITMVAVGLSSVARMWAMAWAAPILWLTFVTKFEEVETRRLSQITLGLALLFIAKESFLIQKDMFSTFYDVPIAEATTELTIPPLAGIKTSPRRAELIEKLATAVKDKHFAVTFGGLPGIFYFGNLRSAINTIFSDIEAPKSLIRDGLDYMVKNNRIPDVIILSKTYAWTWGMEFPPTPPSVQTPYAERINHNPFMDFAECARGNALLVEPEVEVWAVERARVESCAAR